MIACLLLSTLLVPSCARPFWVEQPYYTDNATTIYRELLKNTSRDNLPFRAANPTPLTTQPRA